MHVAKFHWGPEDNTITDKDYPSLCSFPYDKKQIYLIIRTEFTFEVYKNLNVEPSKQKQDVTNLS